MTKFVVLIIAIFLLLAPASVNAYYTNMDASVVIGQPNFTSNSSNQGGSPTERTLSSPRDFTICDGKLIVADRNNHRVLIYEKIPTTNNFSASVVVGQQDFTSNQINQGGSTGANTLNQPNGVACADGKLLVADRQNRRVLIFNEVPTQNNASADVVIGQPDFITGSSSVCSAQTFGPHNETHIVWTGEKLIIADAGRSRVLIFNEIPTQNYASADVVIGQADFTSCSANRGGSVGANTLNQDLRGIHYDGERFYVADFNNSRVLIWNSLPTVNGVPADVVIGQSDFTSSDPNQGGDPAANTTWSPRGISVNNGRLFLGEWSNSRLLIFNSIPTQNNASADLVLGQADFASSAANQGGGPDANTFSSAGEVIEYNNRLLALDTSNNRILIFDNIISTPGIHLGELEEVGGKLRVNGSVHLGEPENYYLHDVRVSINGEGSKFVTHIEAGETHGEVNIYEWYHDFDPPENDQYTLKFTSSSQNADDSSLFYFNPFVLNSINGKVIFSVPKDHVNTIKSEVSHFEVFTRINDQSEWTKLGDNISTSNIDEHGTVSVNLFASGEVKIVAVSKGSNWRQDSNTLYSENVGEYINPNNYFVSVGWFPLQINSITGVTKNILSSYAPTQIDSIYQSITRNPVFEGIAFNNSTVAMRVTNSADPSEYREYFSTSTDSNWSIKPTLYQKSVIHLSVYDNFGNYNQILPLTVGFQ